MAALVQISDQNMRHTPTQSKRADVRSSKTPQQPTSVEQAMCFEMVNRLYRRNADDNAPLVPGATLSSGACDGLVLTAIRERSLRRGFCGNCPLNSACRRENPFKPYSKTPPPQGHRPTVASDTGDAGRHLSA